MENLCIIVNYVLQERNELYKDRKMKRKIFLLLLVACFAVFSFGQRRSRTAIQKIIQLTKPDTSGKMTFEQGISQLKNANRFTGQSIDRTVISQLAWAGQGYLITPGIIQLNPQPLQSPFPIQLFFITNEGVFFYQPINNSLEQVTEGDVRPVLATAVSNPDPVSSAGCVILITSNATRNTATRRGGANSISNTRTAMLLDAGRIAQNIQLQTVCLGQGLGSTAIGDFEPRAVISACRLSREYEALYMVCVGYMTEQDKQTEAGSPNTAAAKRAAVIVPSENFDNAEFYDTLNAFSAVGIQVTVASNRLGPIRGVVPSAAPFEVQVLANQIRADDFDGIVIIGGPGAAAFFNDQVVGRLVNDAFNNKRKIIGAAGEAVIVLANSGILRSGVKVTCPPAAAMTISQSGAMVNTMEPVVNDSKVITCNGPAVSVKFGRELADAIMGK